MRKMKDSGIDWIGAIPEDWNLAQVRYLFRIGRGRVIAQTELKDDGIYPVYSSQTKNNGCLGYIDTYDFDVSQLTWTTDGANAGTVFLREGKHNCTNVCGTLQLTNDEQDLKFQKYALEYIAVYHKRADTNGYKIMNNEMAAIRTVCPPLDVQKRIALFLDSKCARIDDIIVKHNQIIEKLKIYKSSYISEILSNELYRTVTLRYCIDLIEQGSSPSPATEIVENGWKVLSLAAVKCGIFYADATKHIDTADSSERLRIKDGDFLMTRSNTRELVGDVCIVRNCPENTIFSDLIYRITFKDTIFPEYACYALRSASARQQIQEAARGSSGSMPKISHKSIKEIKMPVPSLDVQKKIVAILDDKCNKIDADIAKRQQLIDKLTEYKKSLIFEVVTGKKEV